MMITTRYIAKGHAMQKLLRLNSLVCVEGMPKVVAQLPTSTPPAIHVRSAPGRGSRSSGLRTHSLLTAMRRPWTR